MFAILIDKGGSTDPNDITFFDDLPTAVREFNIMVDAVWTETEVLKEMETSADRWVYGDTIECDNVYLFRVLR